MELDPPRGKSTASRISHSQEETTANGGRMSDMITDFPRRSSRSAFLRRFLIFSSICLNHFSGEDSSVLLSFLLVYIPSLSEEPVSLSHVTQSLVFVCYSPHFLPLSSADGRRRTIRSLPRSSKDPLKGGRVGETAIPPPAAATLCAPKGAPSDGRKGEPRSESPSDRDRARWSATPAPRSMGRLDSSVSITLNTVNTLLIVTRSVPILCPHPENNNPYGR